MLQKPQSGFATHALHCIFFEQGYTDDLFEQIEQNTDLRDDYGLDSQEIVVLACAASALCVGAPELQDGDITLVSDVLEYLEKNLNPWLGNSTQMVMQGSVLIPQPAGRVFSYIADCESWPDHLDHVVAIDDLNRDGMAETFCMTIRELTDGREYSVDSSRFVNRDRQEIDFAQPRPPEGFEIHMGGWRFIPVGPDKTELVSFHMFALKDGADLEEATMLIRKHIRAALRTWAEVGGR